LPKPTKVKPILTNLQKKMKFFLASLLIGSAAAFAPAQTGKASTALNAAADYESYPGVLAPVGFFDPLGLADKADPALFKKYREAELTHGRVGKSMHACGFIILSDAQRVADTIFATRNQSTNFRVRALEIYLAIPPNSEWNSVRVQRILSFATPP